MKNCVRSGLASAETEINRVTESAQEALKVSSDEAKPAQEEVKQAQDETKPPQALENK